MGFSGNIARDRGALGTILQRLGLPVSIASPLLAHASAVAEAAERLGLVALGDREDLVVRHTADSLLFALARRPKRGERWVDAGSGAGFPGLVLACAYPATSFTLIEPNSRRAGFLELQATTLGLTNVVIEPRRIEEVDPEADVAVARALAKPAETILKVRSLVRPGGLVIVAGGPNVTVPADASVVRLEDLGDVDSPGVLFMMSREG